MSRIALVVQRYASEISGGAERHARLVAELLAATHELTVLTSCALEYTRWQPHFEPGEHRVNGIRVLRFANHLRNDIGRARVHLPHKLRFKLRRLFALLPGARVLRPRGDPGFDGIEFLRRQGPHAPTLFEHLQASRERYDVVIFFTALYEPAAKGILVWGRRSILVPLLHDEKPLYQPVFHDVFRAAGRILFNSASERRLASKLYGMETAGEPLAGIGVEMPDPDPAWLADVLSRRCLKPGYLVYVGRIDRSKGCDELLAAFLEVARTNPDATLVLVGQSVMSIPEHPRIVQTGFVSEAERDALVAAAGALVLASRYESLSAVVLEAMLLRTPVVVNGACEVLADHVHDSACGIAYHGRRELVRAMRQMLKLTDSQRREAGERGSAYVRQNYRWPQVMSVYADAIQQVSQNV